MSCGGKWSAWLWYVAVLSSRRWPLNQHIWQSANPTSRTRSGYGNGRYRRLLYWEGRGGPLKKFFAVDVYIDCHQRLWHATVHVRECCSEDPSLSIENREPIYIRTTFHRPPFDLNGSFHPPSSSLVPVSLLTLDFFFVILVTYCWLSTWLYLLDVGIV